MRSPFPGMDPFLEHPAHFPDLHDRFIAYLGEALGTSLPEPYFAGIASRVWVEMSQRLVGPDVKILLSNEPNRTKSSGGSAAVAEMPEVEPIVVHVPDDEVREPFLEIYFGPDQKRLVTSIEVLSLSNKKPGVQARDLYLEKQSEMLHSRVHLVEIDLLRAGEHTTAVHLPSLLARCGYLDYHVCIRRYDAPADPIAYPIRLAQRLPTISVPLLPDDEPVRIDLQTVFDRCYAVGTYERRLNYAGPIVPPLSPERETWARQVIAQWKGKA
jgi:hypothetical protein